MRQVLLAGGVAVVLLVAACGEEGLLDGLGSRSQEAVLKPVETTTTVVLDTDDGDEVAAVAATDVTWFNDAIARQAEGDPEVVISRVWGRKDGDSRFIQASRLEIAAALPDIRFPGLIPSEVGWITSQLVYDVSSATLDRDTSAAFGLWAVEPYTVADGRLAVLRIGEADEGERGAAFEIIPDVVDDGLSLNWVTGSYRYELFCRASLGEDLCWQMAETNKLLSAQLRGSGRASEGL